MSNNVYFKGFKQVLKGAYDGTNAEDRKGYLWLVRPDSASTKGDIYFGNRHYGHFGDEAENIENINNILAEAGIVDEHGNAVNIAELITNATLTAGDGLSLSGTTISVNVAEDTVDTKNYLKLTNDELSITEMETSALKTKEAITIAGGPWAEDVKKIYTSGTLPAGEDLQTFLFRMLCKELWGNPGNPVYTFTATVSNPTISGFGSGSVPVGTMYQVSATPNYSLRHEVKVEIDGYTYGTYYVDKDIKYPNAKKYSESTSCSVDTSTQSLTVSYSGCKSLDGSTIPSNTGASTNVYIRKGDNTITANQTGGKCTKSNFTARTVKKLSNLGNVSEDDARTIVAEGVGLQPSITPTSSASQTITGFYPVYYGPKNLVTADMTNPAGVITADFIKGLSSGGNKAAWTTSVSIPASMGSYFIAVPTGHTGYTKTGIALIAQGNKLPFGSSVNFGTISIPMLNDVENVSYRVFYIVNDSVTGNAGTFDASFV